MEVVLFLLNTLKYINFKILILATQIHRNAFSL